MYAVIETGGKQYRVTPGELIQIEKIPGEVGDQLDLDQVLLISPDDGEMIVGRPMIEGARVIGSIIGDRRGRKLIIQKFKRRKRYRTRTGHRQEYRQVRIEAIRLPGYEAEAETEAQEETKQQIETSEISPNGAETPIEKTEIT